MGFAGTQLGLFPDNPPPPAAVAAAVRALDEVQTRQQTVSEALKQAAKRTEQQRSSIDVARVSIQRTAPKEEASQACGSYKNVSTFHAALTLSNDFLVSVWVRENVDATGALSTRKLKQQFSRIVDYNNFSNPVSVQHGYLALPDFCSGDEIDWQVVADELTSDIREQMSEFDTLSDVELLQRCEVVGNVVRMHAQLRPETYSRLKSALEKLGGKWSREDRGHVFKKAPKALIEKAAQDGKVIKPDDHDFFATSEARADALVALAQPQAGETFVEPSAGEGAIADAIRRASSLTRVVVGEIDQDRANILREKGYSVAFSDFLEFNPTEAPDAVCMNPPFSEGRDITHVMHAWRILKPGGRIAAIMSAGVLGKSNRKAATFRDLLHAHGTYTELPAGEFKHAGTMVRTVQVLLRKPTEQ